MYYVLYIYIYILEHAETRKVLGNHELLKKEHNEGNTRGTQDEKNRKQIKCENMLNSKKTQEP